MTTRPENKVKECIACGLTNSFIFNVRHRGFYRRFCTACLLKNHSGSFCPICFDVFDHSNPLPSHLRLICFNCSSVSHLSCVNPPPSSTRYRCPTCSDSNFSFFDLSSSDNKKFRTNNGLPLQRKSINEYLAKQFLAAAEIAAASMTKAAESARLDAEKKVKEDADTRKEAREALELLAQLVAKEESESRPQTTGGGLQKFNFASPCLPLNRVQNQSPANGSASSVINAVSLPETIRKESNGLHSSVSRH